MARQEAVPESELAICRRLRDFRLRTKIPRSVFALVVGISANRLSEHENGRVPVRYEVFAAIHRLYFVNPKWLVEGDGPMAFDAPLDFSKISPRCSERELLSNCFRQSLRNELRRLQYVHALSLFGPNGLQEKVKEYARLASLTGGADYFIDFEIEDMISELQGVLKKVRAQRVRSSRKQPAKDSGGDKGS